MTEVDEDLIRALLVQQVPELADRPIRLGARGWDNQTWRLGDDLAVRLPWMTTGADALLEKEWRWVPRLAPGLPLPVPVPQHLGRPSALLPRSWIVTTWVPGEPADRVPVRDGGDGAERLAAFLRALHRPAPSDAPLGRDRGGPLGAVRRGFEAHLARAADAGLVSDAGAVRAVWEDAVAAPPWREAPVWLHADLHPANVLTADGRLGGVIDFGDLCAGDPAWDLAGAWLLLPPRDLPRFRRACGADEATWRRARGAAVVRALVGLLIGAAGGRGEPGGKPTWGPPAARALEALVDS